MTSKPKSLPLQSMLQQWTQRRPVVPYRILIQQASGLALRTQAANTEVDNIDVYKRAKVRTPSESAHRDLLASRLVVEYMVQVLGRATTTTSGCSILYIPTTPSPSLSFGNENDMKITILDTQFDPFGWDDGDDDKSSTVNFDNLKSLSVAIQNFLDETEAPVIVFESLTPLLQRHGLSKTLAFIDQFSSNCLQILPVRQDGLTKQQHARLEDESQALLWIQSGELQLLRQGIREPGSMVRQTILFDIEQQSKDGAFEFVEQREPASSPSEGEASGQVTSSGASANAIDEGGAVKSKARRGTQLKLEEEEEETKQNSGATNRPRIFLQDDDPEFDDMDEEDPDDDLDI